MALSALQGSSMVKCTRRRRFLHCAAYTDASPEDNPPPPFSPSTGAGSPQLVAAPGTASTIWCCTALVHIGVKQAGIAIPDSDLTSSHLVRSKCRDAQADVFQEFEIRTI